MKKALVFISMLFGLFMLAFTTSCEMDTDSGDNTSIVNPTEPIDPTEETRFVKLTIRYYRYENYKRVTIREDEFTDVEVSDYDENEMFITFVNSNISSSLPENESYEKDGVIYTYVYDSVTEWDGYWEGHLEEDDLNKEIRTVEIKVLFHIDEYVIPPTPTYTITVRNFYNTCGVLTKTVEKGDVINIEDYITEQMKKVNLNVGNCDTDTYILYDYLVNEDGTKYDPTLPITNNVTLYPHITVPKNKIYGSVIDKVAIVCLEDKKYYEEYKDTLAFYKLNPNGSSLGGHFSTYGVLNVTNDYVNGYKHTYININSSYKNRLTMEVETIKVSRDIIHIVYVN